MNEKKYFVLWLLSNCVLCILSIGVIILTLMNSNYLIDEQNLYIWITASAFILVGSVICTLFIYNKAKEKK